jgi:hypothetical protein
VQQLNFNEYDQYDFLLTQTVLFHIGQYLLEIGLWKNCTAAQKPDGIFE